MAATLDAVVAEIRRIQDDARERRVHRAAGLADDRAAHARRAGPARRRSTASGCEGYWRAHQVPMGDMHEARSTSSMLEALDEELPAGGAVRRRRAAQARARRAGARRATRRMSANPHANGGAAAARSAAAGLPRLCGRGADARRGDGRGDARHGQVSARRDEAQPRDARTSASSARTRPPPTAGRTCSR